MMTSRERLLNVFNGGNGDRTPITIFVSDTDVSDGLVDNIIRTRSGDRISDLIKFHEILDIDIMLRVSTNIYEPLAFDCDGESWQNIWEPLSDGKYLVHRIVTPQGELKEVFNVEGEIFTEDSYKKDWMKLRNIRVEALVKTVDDLELIKKYRPPIPLYHLEHISEIKKKLGDSGVVLPRASSSVFNYASGLMKLEDLLIAPLIQTELYNELMAFCVQDVTTVSRQVVDADGDVVRIIGNIANGGMMSDKFYLDFVFPFEKQLVDFITSCGGKILFHNCGKSQSLLKIYKRLLDGHALESLSTPDSGGDIASLKESRELLGQNIVMVGNFDQVTLLKNGLPNQIRHEVKHIFNQISSDKKFIFSTSDSIIPGTPAENIIALAEMARECSMKIYNQDNQKK